MYCGGVRSEHEVLSAGYVRKWLRGECQNQMQEVEGLILTGQHDHVRKIGKIDDDVLHEVEEVGVSSHKQRTSAKAFNNAGQKSNNERSRKLLVIRLKEREITDNRGYAKKTVEHLSKSYS